MGAEDQILLGAQDGYLHVMWPQTATLMLPVRQRQWREAIGWIVLLGMAYGSLWLAMREPSTRVR
ncbi:MAG: hypothetical protein ACRDF5_10740 [bacterium]